MPRALRSDVAGQIYHALNRGNARNNIFFKDGDFEAFERVIKQGLEKYPVDLIAYQWMSNHWHLSGRCDPFKILATRRIVAHLKKQCQIK